MKCDRVSAAAFPPLAADEWIVTPPAPVKVVVTLPAGVPVSLFDAGWLNCLHVHRLRVEQPRADMRATLRGVREHALNSRVHAGFECLDAGKELLEDCRHNPEALYALAEYLLQRVYPLRQSQPMKGTT